MDIQEKRDQKTIVIATAIGIFTLIVIVGATALWVADSLLGWSDDNIGALRPALFAVSGAAVVVYLARARRR